MSDTTKAALDAAISIVREANRDWSTAARQWGEEKTTLKSRISLLEAMLKRRDRGMHTIGQHAQGCPGLYPSGRCICGHDDVAKYFKEKRK